MSTRSKRKASQKSSETAKKAKAVPKAASTKEKETKETPAPGKRYLAICNVNLDTITSLGPLGTVSMNSQLCLTSDVHPYYHQAINQAKGRAADKVKDKFFPREAHAGWDDSWDASKKLVAIKLMITMGFVSIKRLEMTTWIQEFVDGKLVGMPLVAPDGSPTDHNPASKVNPE